jgi:hypothetical protein
MEEAMTALELSDVQGAGAVCAAPRHGLNPTDIGICASGVPGFAKKSVVLFGGPLRDRTPIVTAAG